MPSSPPSSAPCGRLRATDWSDGARPSCGRTLVARRRSQRVRVSTRRGSRMYARSKAFVNASAPVSRDGRGRDGRGIFLGSWGSACVPRRRDVNYHPCLSL